jgi:Zn-dependent protease
LFRLLERKQNQNPFLSVRIPFAEKNQPSSTLIAHMRGVWKIVNISGIPVQIHWSFSLLFFWIYFEGIRNELEWGEMLAFTVLLLTLFVCVVFHEFGHALAARHYGVSTKDITLSPIGGAARLNKLPDRPLHEFIIAVAGPAVNLIIAGVLVLAMWGFSISLVPELASNPMKVFSNSANFFQLILILNVFLALFNLIPAFPLDGGRMLRAVLSVKLGRLTATRIASLIGRIIAMVLLGFAIYHGDFLFALLSLFVFFMAAHEYYMVRLDDVMHSKTVADLAQADFTRLHIADTMEQAVRVFSERREKNFLVFDQEDKLCGVLLEKAIQQAIKEKEVHTSIEQWISPVYGAALLEDKIETVYYRMDNPTFSVLPVYDAGVLIGMIDLERINLFIKNNMSTRFSI